MKNKNIKTIREIKNFFEDDSYLDLKAFEIRFKYDRNVYSINRNGICFADRSGRLPFEVFDNSTEVKIISLVCDNSVKEGENDGEED